jgi:hypothetical protein
VLLATDAVAITSALFFALAARASGTRPVIETDLLQVER